MPSKPLTPVPKPEGGKKGKSKTPTKTVGTIAADERAAQNNRNRNFGKAVERKVADLTGGHRTPMSGAIKHSNWNLTGDVEVKDASGRDFLKIECKGTSTITPKGDKTFSLKKSVLDQAVKEAEDVGEIGVLYVHWANANYEHDDYVILKNAHFLRFLELAKIGHAVEQGTYEN
jgi:hypothetical protein